MVEDTDFLAWYERWLDEAMAGIRWCLFEPPTAINNGTYDDEPPF